MDTTPQMPKRVKFIRKVWAKLNEKLDAIPKRWMQLAGYTLFAIAFGVTIYEFLIVGLFLS